MFLMLLIWRVCFLVVIQLNTINHRRTATYLKYKELTDEEKEEHKECPITRKPYNEEDKIIKTNCGHISSQEALTVWLNRNRICPMCRSNLYL